VRRAALLAALLPFAGCASATTSSSTPDLLDPSQPRDPAPVVIVSAAGVSPQVSHLDRSTPVRFTNQDSVAHLIESAPELRYDDCAELHGMPSLGPGESPSVSVTRGGAVCAFHDAAQPANRAFQGLLVVH